MGSTRKHAFECDGQNGLVDGQRWRLWASHFQVSRLGSYADPILRQCREDACRELKFRSPTFESVQIVSWINDNFPECDATTEKQFWEANSQHGLPEDEQSLQIYLGGFVKGALAITGTFSYGPVDPILGAETVKV